MHFIDEVKVFIKSGDGGDGCVSFRREKFIEFGGPNGGDGGRGGSVFLEVVSGLNTLIDFRYQQHFKAKKGGNGSGNDRSGPKADDIVIRVPQGTQILDEDGEELLADLTKIGERLCIARGGDGGLGNAHFKSSVMQAPRKATPGWPGEEKWVWLKLKLLSDAGIIGLPNAGKSTFLSVVSRAKPKIADYPFTTLTPQLGVVRSDDKEFVLADIPGLIEGAHTGSGLGDRFLKHIERCGVLLHLIDASSDDVIRDYDIIRHECACYHKALCQKPEIIALNKADIVSEDELSSKQEMLAGHTNQHVYVMSGVTHQGVETVLRALQHQVDRFRQATKDQESSTPIFQKPYHPLDD